MNDLFSYRVTDFIPYTQEAYLSLLARMSETYSPLTVPAMLMGLFSAYLALSGARRSALLSNAPAWLFVAIAYYMQVYSELNWAANYIAMAYAAQAGLFLLFASSHVFQRWMSEPTFAFKIAALVLALMGLVVCPLIAPLKGEAWSQAQTFGLYPLPTVITSLAITLVCFRSWVRYLCLVVPVLSLSVMSLHYWALFGVLPYMHMAAFVILIVAFIAEAKTAKVAS